MKFGKLIQSLIDNALPTWKDKFLAYKYLKKRLNSLLSESIRAAEERQGIPYAGNDMGSHPAAHGSEVDASDGHARVLLGEKRGRQMHEQGRIAKRRHLLDDAEFRRVLEEEFRRLLDGELDKMNDFVIDKEEDFVMKLQWNKAQSSKWVKAPSLPDALGCDTISVKCSSQWHEEKSGRNNDYLLRGNGLTSWFKHKNRIIQLPF